MNKFAKVKYTLALVIVFGSIILLVNHAREPMYRGKSLTTWLALYQSQYRPVGPAFENMPNEARAAIQSIGAKGVPTLLALAQARDSKYTAWMAEPDLHRAVGIIPVLRSPKVRREMALLGFYTIGTNGATAVPELIRLGQKPETSQVALMCLGHIGPPAKQAVPLLISIASGTNEKRWVAILVLGKIHSRADLVVPLLITNLITTTESYPSIVALGKYGRQATSAVPFLMPYLEKTNIPGMQMAVTNALKSIDPEAAARLGIK